MIIKSVRLERLKHRDHPVVAIRFEKDWELIKRVKMLALVRFSWTNLFWYVPDAPGILEAIKDVFDGVANLDYSALNDEPRNEITLRKPFESTSAKDLNDEQQKALRMAEQKLNLKGYSIRTKKTYLEQLKLFMRFLC
jgi:hypothetical protein